MAGVTYEQLVEDDKLQDAVVHRLEIIGEASRQLSDEFKGLHPEAPRQKIIGLRNRIAHEYFGVDIDRVWSIIAIDLSQLEGFVAGWLLELPEDL
jgi:uncharacterized protein with HEPN domain